MNIKIIEDKSIKTQIDEVNKDGTLFVVSCNKDLSFQEGMSAKKFIEDYSISKHELKESIEETYPNLKSRKNLLLTTIKGNITFIFTKKYTYNNATYDSIGNCLELVKKKCIEKGINKIIMPEFFTEEKLQLEHGIKRIKKVFKDSNISIEIYK